MLKDIIAIYSDQLILVVYSPALMVCNGAVGLGQTSGRVAKMGTGLYRVAFSIYREKGDCDSATHA